uniref:Secreted protein n=1 Tax=Anopheles farauti TaxID=69004 RepID=A0A182Q9I9_9DIPT
MLQFVLLLSTASVRAFWWSTSQTSDPPVASKQVQYVRAFTYQPVAFPAHSLLAPPSPYKFVQASPASILPTAKQVQYLSSLPANAPHTPQVQFVPCMCPIAVNVQSHAEVADKRLDETTTTDSEVVVPSGGESEK